MICTKSSEHNKFSVNVIKKKDIFDFKTWWALIYKKSTMSLGNQRLKRKR